MPETESSESDTSSLPGGVYYCSCGMPDAFENWICCDSDGCSVTWYHWECVGVTERPSGYWLCPRCSLKSTTDAKLLKARRGANTSISPIIAKRTLIDPKKAVNDEPKGEQIAANKTPVRSKKGIAVKKAPPKKTKSQWGVGWVETDSEDEEQDIEDVRKAQTAATVAKEKREKRAIATQPKGKLTKSGAVNKASKPAAGVQKSVRFDIPKEIDGFEPLHSGVASLGKDSAE